MGETLAQRPSGITIRQGVKGDFDRLAEIELDAFVVWATACEVALEASATPHRLFQEGMDQGLLLVADDEHTQRSIGFVLGFATLGYLYIAEVDVERASQGRGVGRCLMQSVLNKGRDRGLTSAVLTTDRYARFNAPFYRQLGFEIIDEGETPAFLRERLDKQIESGLDPQRRVAMLARL
ncbi:GNAT family N-acetyltransferase [Agrobacterium larrymoorei]|uniref:GNAT family N-acetyltransferase n=1 Tax=Agrobacterium larrymoorei TaxID=160699 RepID=UPI001573BA4E|nr:GNAT family N-acetyltransferase [Agrobacterium larrymoorei]NTJ41748.1 GNAT family N-acetyltransferase [Agrobacterium larrymoorei]